MPKCIGAEIGGENIDPHFPRFLRMLRGDPHVDRSVMTTWRKTEVFCCKVRPLAPSSLTFFLVKEEEEKWIVSSSFDFLVLIKMPKKRKKNI